jgi:hypothetical protein
MADYALIIKIFLAACIFVFAAHLVAKRFSKSLVENERSLEIGGQIAYYVCKWVTIMFVCYLGLHLLAFWPPHWLEKMRQRKIVVERVQEAGGWEIIKRDCNDLVQSNAETGYQWYSRWNDTNSAALPKSLAALKPRMVDLWLEKDGVVAIRIVIFGAHATGGRGQDFYSLKVICPWPQSAKFPFTVDPSIKVRYGDRKMAEGVYEVTEHG